MSVSDELRVRIRAQAGERCGYCQSAQRYVFAPLEIDHIVPTARGGTDDEDNLWLACRMCNGFKGDRIHGLDPLTGQEVRLFNPREQEWTEHFSWDADGLQVNGLNPMWTRHGGRLAVEQCHRGHGPAGVGVGGLASATFVLTCWRRTVWFGCFVGVAIGRSDGSSVCGHANIA